MDLTRTIRRRAAEWREVVADALNEGETARACPYWRGAGTCGHAWSCSAVGEPMCQTNTPHYGWPKQRVIRGGRRVVYELRPNYRKPYVYRNPGTGRTW